MPKRKRGTETSGAHLVQEPSARPLLRKSTRLLEKASHEILPVQKAKKQRRQNERCGVLPSPSTSGLTREDRHPILLSESNIAKSTDDTSFENHLEKTHSASFGLGAGRKRKYEKELGQAGIESHKQTRKSESTAAPPNLDVKERLKLSEDNGLSRKQQLQFEEKASKTNVPVIESSEKPAEEPKVRNAKQKWRHDRINYWIAHHTWPKNLTEHTSMASSSSIHKRQRTDPSQSGKNEISRSYSQSRKAGEVPEQYTAAYERHILTKGLNMDPFKGEELVSEDSKKLCVDLEPITQKIIAPTIFPTGVIRRVINFCRNRNEAIVNRDVTPMILPSITSLYFGGDNSLEHVIDEVNADWYDQCVLEGPRLRPDLAIGLFSSAFTEEEIDKLKRYSSVDNWTQTTTHMFFPFLMCEVKCGREGLDIADRQNMHSCSVAVRALLRIEQEADKYRSEKKTNILNRQVLVFSISHDQQDARLYGHYAIVQGQKWTYYRYRIRKFDLFDNNSLLAIHNFVRNILKTHLPRHIERLKNAIAALPDPDNPPESSGSSVAASARPLNDDSSKRDSQNRDADGFLVPARPDSSQNSEALVKRIDQLMQQLQEKEEISSQNSEALAKRNDQLMQQLQEKEKISSQNSEAQFKRIDQLMQQLTEDKQKHKEEIERLLGKRAN